MLGVEVVTHRILGWQNTKVNNPLNQVMVQFEKIRRLHLFLRHPEGPRFLQRAEGSPITTHPHPIPTIRIQTAEQTA